VLARVLGLFALAFLILLSGAASWLLIRAIRSSKGDPEDIPPESDGGGFMFGWIAAGMIFDSFLALALALAGVFSSWAFSIIVVAYSLLAVAIARPRLSSLKRYLPSWRELARGLVPLMVVSAVALILFLLPFMYVFGFADEGVYPNTAANIARTGSYQIRDPLVPEMEKNGFNIFYKKYYDKVTIPEAGFYITSFSKGLIVPQFFYLYPSLMALFMSFLGIRGGFLILTLMGMLSVATVYLIAERMSNRWAALASALFLAVSFLEVYFAKFSTSEIATQFFFLAGLYAYLRFRQEGEGKTLRRWWGLLAAGSFGAMMHAHMEAALILVPLALLYCFLFVRDGFRATLSRDRSFLIAMAVFLVSLVPLYVGPYREYTRIIVVSTVHIIPGKWLGALALLIGLAMLTCLLAGPGRRVYLYLMRHRRSAMAVLCVILVIAAIYAQFVRPLFANEKKGEQAPISSRELDKDYRKYAIQRLTFYMTPVSMVLALIGLCLFLFMGLDHKNLLILLAGLTFTFVFTYQPRVNQNLVWAMRRYLPFTVPFLVLMVGYALYAVWIVSSKPKWPGVIRILGEASCIAAVVALLILSSVQIANIARISGGRESYPVSKQVSDMVPDPGAVFVCAGPGKLMAAPLRCILGRKTLWLRDESYLRGQEFARFVAYMHDKETRVFLVVGSESDQEVASSSLGHRRVGGAVYHSEELPLTLEPTTEPVYFEVPFSVFELSPST
jgi:4-amino-4-deoxy-L-arabinose transferase-like glycosyltransferase